MIFFTIKEDRKMINFYNYKCVFTKGEENLTEKVFSGPIIFRVEPGINVS
jgi:hypothetical protein